MKKLEQSNVGSLVIILLAILVTFIISRIGTFLIMVYGILPWSLFVKLGQIRLHHFVYGNILIVITSFLAIGLGVHKHKKLFSLFYGIGLGLVLDEFLLWVGDINQLNSYVLFIPYSIPVIAAVSFFIATLIMLRIFKKKHAGTS